MDDIRFGPCAAIIKANCIDECVTNCSYCNSMMPVGYSHDFECTCIRCTTLFSNKEHTKGHKRQNISKNVDRQIHIGGCDCRKCTTDDVTMIPPYKMVTDYTTKKNIYLADVLILTDYLSHKKINKKIGCELRFVFVKKEKYIHKSFSAIY